MLRGQQKTDGEAHPGSCQGHWFGLISADLKFHLPWSVLPPARGAHLLYMPLLCQRCLKGHIFNNK